MKILLSENVYNLIREDYKTDQPLNIVENLLKRVPFLNEFNIVKQEDNLLMAQKVIFNQDVRMVLLKDVVTLPKFNVACDFYYRRWQNYDNIFYVFDIKYTFAAKLPEDIDRTLSTIFSVANKKKAELMSYSKEVILKEGVNFDPKKLSEIINEINGNFFAIEDFTNQKNIDFFD